MDATQGVSLAPRTPPRRRQAWLSRTPPTSPASPVSTTSTTSTATTSISDFSPTVAISILPGPIGEPRRPVGRIPHEMPPRLDLLSPQSPYSSSSSSPYLIDFDSSSSSSTTSTISLSESVSYRAVAGLPGVPPIAIPSPPRSPTIRRVSRSRPPMSHPPSPAFPSASTASTAASMSAARSPLLSSVEWGELLLPPALPDDRVSDSDTSTSRSTTTLHPRSALMMSCHFAS